MDSRLSFVVPAISAAIIALVLMRPEITGFAVSPGGIMQAGIMVATAEGVILPRDSVVTISIDEEEASMPVSAFISKSARPYELVEGEVPEIGYEGLGYTGNHTYMVQLSEFDLARDLQPGTHTLTVKITYKGVVISASEREIVV